MPELPEVETTVRGLRPILAGARIDRVLLNRADLRRPFPADLGQRLTGAVVTVLGRRAKYGLIDTDRGDTMIFHLGMSGRWRVDPTEQLPHDHLVIETASGRTLALNDPRRFGFVDLWPTAMLPDYPPFAAMGPEPLGPDLTGAYLRRALAGRSAPIKAVLLNQALVAGLGNMYVDEALFQARVHPERPAGSLDASELKRLHRAIRDRLAAAVAAGGASIDSYRDGLGEKGTMQDLLRVHLHEGEPCPNCRTTIRKTRVAQRGTYWCPRCQTPPAPW